MNIDEYDNLIAHKIDKLLSDHCKYCGKPIPEERLKYKHINGGEDCGNHFDINNKKRSRFKNY